MNDGQQPGPSVGDGSVADGAVCSQACLLHHVLRVGRVSGQGTRQRVGSRKVRQHHPREA